ncbi:pyridoxamine 5'-phosphate oxidase family protein [Pseudoflavonifractor sp. AF19-9AC]|uniref:pyridoxamine 5'-phosphate oxidase family protein n=1 Tax=Pseudoflavonifractor sp. AF19-9AC TaxID=2292244 RepID=UPI000E47595C|nr:pyridoxamine 5'-phosphate oxidase family protein [Pseudoflavonifractor sp. AF19-9AC]RHR08844.1 pyridoxamine 5'-phosphate oxidase family protein [Pseudoflavonifractor sp. AF19-9AC]
MRRSDRAQSREFALELMDRCTYGVVSISTGENTPYCLPLSLVRVDNRLYFHCAKAGRKLDLLRRNPRVCVTFVGASEPAYVAEKNMYTDYFQSAMVTGTAVEVLEEDEKLEALRALCTKMTPEGMTGDNFERAMAGSLAATGVWRIDMEEITAKAKLHD